MSALGTDPDRYRALINVAGDKPKLLLLIRALIAEGARARLAAQTKPGEQELPLEPLSSVSSVSPIRATLWWSDAALRFDATCKKALPDATLEDRTAPLELREIGLPLVEPPNDEPQWESEGYDGARPSVSPPAARTESVTPAPVLSAPSSTEEIVKLISELLCGQGAKNTPATAAPVVWQSSPIEDTAGGPVEDTTDGIAEFRSSTPATAKSVVSAPSPVEDSAESIAELLSDQAVKTTLATPAPAVSPPSAARDIAEQIAEFLSSEAAKITPATAIPVVSVGSPVEDIAELIADFLSCQAAQATAIPVVPAPEATAEMIVESPNSRSARITSLASTAHADDDEENSIAAEIQAALEKHSRY